MKRLTFVIAIGMFCCNYINAQDSTLQFVIPPAKYIQQDTVVVKVGDTTHVNIVTHTYNVPGLQMLIIHDNENTGSEAAYLLMEDYGGRLVELQYGNIRNIAYKKDKLFFAFDPNGIYTKAGAKHRLKRVNQQHNEHAVKQMNNLGKKVLKAYCDSTPKYMITLHNNTEGYFNIMSYKKDKELQSVVRKIYIAPDMDLDDFLYVTDERFFNYLKKRNISVVLQNHNIKDDGSLSVYAAQNNIPYINLEIQHSHLKVQHKLLQVVYEMLYSNELKHLLW